VISNKLDGIFAAADGPLHWLRLQESPLPTTDPPEFLGTREIEYCTTLKSDKRRHDWLLGRWAAKQLVANIIQRRTTRTISLDQITILPHADGWPVVTLGSMVDPPTLTLSISHTRQTAFCAAIERADQPLGADIEVVEPRSVAFAEAYFTHLENRFLAAAPPEQRPSLVNAIWSGKEAALKAIRRGLAEDTRIVSCLPHPLMADGPDWMPMRIVWTEERLNRPLPRLSGLWRSDGEFVMTLAFVAPST
jgi:4'-phosphopantetheinyl transferase